MSKFVIYRKSDSKIMINSKTRKEFYASIGRAKLALSKMIENRQLIENTECSTYACEELDFYRKNIEQFRMVKNLLSGKEVRESVNTPNYCSVGSEAYFCM